MTRKTIAAGIVSAAALGIGVTIAACTPTQQASVTTLASLAAANSTTVATLVAKGQLFCGKIAGTDADVVAVSNIASATGLPFASVLGAAANVVAGVCQAINLVPVPPPSTIPLASVPVVATPAAAALPPKT